MKRTMTIRFCTLIVVILSGILASSCLFIVPPPVWSEIPDQTVDAGMDLTLDLSAYASDPEGRKLVYSVTSGPGTVNRDTGMYTFNSPVPGEFDVEVAVSNGLKDVRETFMVRVE